MVFFREKGTVFFPDPTLIGTPADLGLTYEEVFFTTDDGIRLHGWDVPFQKSPITLLWVHGNAGNRPGARRRGRAPLSWYHSGVGLYLDRRCDAPLFSFPPPVAAGHDQIRLPRTHREGDGPQAGHPRRAC